MGIESHFDVKDLFFYINAFLESTPHETSPGSNGEIPMSAVKWYATPGGRHGMGECTLVQTFFNSIFYCN